MKYLIVLRNLSGEIDLGRWLQKLAIYDKCMINFIKISCDLKIANFQEKFNFLKKSYLKYLHLIVVT